MTDNQLLSTQDVPDNEKHKRKSVRPQGPGLIWKVFIIAFKMIEFLWLILQILQTLLGGFRR